MANYIDQEILCEAYTHFDVDEYPDENTRQKLRIDLTRFFQERATFLFGQGVEVAVVFEQGSLKTKLQVIGSTAVLAATIISNYGSIRQGFEQIAKDSAMLAQSGVLEIAFRTKTAYCDRVNTEKRKGVFGRAYEKIQALDGIRESLSETVMPTNIDQLAKFLKVTDRLTRWDKETDILFSKLENESSIACVAAGLLEELEKLSNEPYWAGDLNGSSLRIKALRSEVALHADVKGSVARYSAIAATIKKKMLDRVEQYAPKKV